MGRRLWHVAATAALAVTGVVEAGDWYQWRGPERDGVVTDSPPLMGRFPEDGLKPVWQSERILGHREGGYGSVAVADGKAYVYSNWKCRAPIDTRTLTAKVLKDRLGGSAGVPGELQRRPRPESRSPKQCHRPLELRTNDREAFK